MMRTACLMTLMLLVVTAPARAGEMPWEGTEPRGGGDPGIVFQQVPNQAGGVFSDTSFAVFGLPESTQQVAEDVVLASGASIRRIIWWGFYFQSLPPGPGEGFRLRIYGPRPGDNLPDDNMILRTETVIDPSRTATGRLIGVQGLPEEFIYQVDLSSPFEMAADTLYWFEIVQLGDVSTAFTWESSLDINNPAAVNGPFTNGWELFDEADVAFQLSTIPEPSTVELIALLVILIRPRRGKKRRVYQNPDTVIREC